MSLGMKKPMFCSLLLKHPWHHGAVLVCETQPNKRPSEPEVGVVWLETAGLGALVWCCLDGRAANFGRHVRRRNWKRSSKLTTSKRQEMTSGQQRSGCKRVATGSKETIEDVMHVGTNIPGFL